jgi:cysteine desulfurase / selenocysteine lyase
VNRIRSEFPILGKTTDKEGLVYLDNAATTQKPTFVLDEVRLFYETHNANVHRMFHPWELAATRYFEDARNVVRQHINAEFCEEIVFTRGTTESINLLAFAYGEKFVGKGDEVLVTELEHHSNFVPWLQLCRRKQAKLKIIPLCGNGTLDLSVLKRMLSRRTKIISLTHVSNVLGTVNPVADVVAMAKPLGIPVSVDGAQSVAHFKPDVLELGCDFYSFSGHKMFAPGGTGILYARKRWLEQMVPWQTGGEMMSRVTASHATYNNLPYRFEAGALDYAGICGLSAAIRFLNGTGWDRIQRHESKLCQYTFKRFTKLQHIRMFSNPENCRGIISFKCQDMHSYDVAVMLNSMGIALSSGEHCAQPLMNALGVESLLRISFAFYNTVEEIDHLIEAIRWIRRRANGTSKALNNKLVRHFSV